MSNLKQEAVELLRQARDKWTEAGYPSDFVSLAIDVSREEKGELPYVCLYCCGYNHGSEVMLEAVSDEKELATGDAIEFTFSTTTSGWSLWKRIKLAIDEGWSILRGWYISHEFFVSREELGKLKEFISKV